MTQLDESKDLSLNEITGAILESSLQIHTALGPGMLESVYEMILTRELNSLGLRVSRQHKINFKYKDLFFEGACTADLLVEDRVIVEIKSLHQLAPVHTKQLLTYLKLMNCQVGLLINFGGATLKEGIKRVVNNMADDTHSRLAVTALGE